MNIDREVERLRNEEYCGSIEEYDDDPYGIKIDDIEGEADE